MNIERECALCAAIRPEDAGKLETLGGSPDPYSAPYGEIRQCPRCKALYVYCRDHDNEIGYQASSPSLERLSEARARDMMAEALTVARRQYEYFSKQTDEYAKRAAAEYLAEIARLGGQRAD